MLTQLAALGIGLITTVGTPVAAQAAPCLTPSSSYPSHGVPVPGYSPVPTYSPMPRYQPVPAYTPRAPRDHQVDARNADTLRWADRNGDSYLSRYELGTDRTRSPLPTAPRTNAVTWSWNWSL